MTKHGAPDWSVYRIDSATYTVMDLAELAARLGSIVVFDRRGDVTFLENFDNGHARWDTTLEGADASVSISPDHFRTAGYSVALTCGSDGQRSAGIRILTPYPRQANYGLEASFTLEALHIAFVLGLTIYDGTDAHNFVVRYLRATGTLQYLDQDGNYQALTPTCRTYESDHLFNSLKLVATPITDVYDRAILNRQAYDLTALTGRVTPNLADQHFQIDIFYTGAADENPVGYVDDVILTQDEP